MGPARVVISGGGSGIGLALVRRLLARGQPVDTIGRRALSELPSLAELDTQYPGALTHHVADLGDPDSTAAVAERLSGPNAAVVHCAGQLPNTQAMAHPRSRRAELARLVDLHAGAIVQLVGQLAPRLIEGSRIVLVGSNLTGRVAPGLGPYAAAKGAVEVLTRYLAVELAPHTAVLCVAPGIVDTPMSTDVLADVALMQSVVTHTPLSRVASAADIATMIDALLTVEPCWMTGQVLTVDEGISLTWPVVS